jgi:hypothetical protein
MYPAQPITFEAVLRDELGFQQHFPTQRTFSDLCAETIESCTDNSVLRITQQVWIA